MPDLRTLPDGFLDRVWNRLCDVDDDSSRQEALVAIEEVCDWFNELDPERFPLIVEGELVQEGDDE